MAQRIRKTQEEEILEILEREGFQELSESVIEEEPYRSIYAFTGCFKEANEIEFQDV